MNNECMRRNLVIGLVVAFTIVSFSPSAASAKSTKLIAEFQKYLDSAQSNYSQAIRDAEEEFQPLMTSAQQRVQTAVLSLKSANKVKVLKLGTNRSYWGQFDCPANRINCIGVDKGPEFQVGEIINIKENVLQDGDQLYVMQLILADGLVELQSPTTYLSAVDLFRTASNDFARASNGLIDAKISASSVRLESLEYSEAIRVAKLAAKRADKSPATFDRAFSNAFIFEYNRVQLDKYASTPFLDINSLKALNNLVTLTKLSAQADQVSSSYTFSSANRLNKLCGDTFTSEPNFKSDFAMIAKIYKKATRISLSPRI
jgi:hypothetical protein